jgi:hypothetical protein
MTIIGFSRRRAAGSAIARVSLIATACVTLGACAHSGALTQGEVGRSGARSFSAPVEHVFYACLGILKADGYEIATVDPEHGLITTKPMAIDSKDRVTARAYRVTISSEGDSTRVVAQPLLYAGNRDISSDEVWNVDAERAQWAELFSDVDAVIAAPIQVMPETAGQQAVAAKAPAATEEDRALAKRPAPRTGSGFTPAALDPPKTGTGAGTSRRETTKTENKTAPSSP